MMHYELEHVVCNYCSSDKYSVTYQKKGTAVPIQFNIVKCEVCGLVYVNPRVKEEQSVNLYNHSYYHGEGIDKSFTGSDTKKEIDAKLLAKCIKDNFINTELTNIKLLDVGGGEGLVSWYAKQMGFDTLLVDISAEAVRKAKERNINVHKGTITEKYFDSQINKYDVIVALEVVEHLYDPMIFFKRVFQLLKKGGIFIYTTGNYNETRIDKDKWGYLQIPEIHLYYYTPKTIINYLTAAGFCEYIDPYKYYYKNNICVRILSKIGIANTYIKTKPASIIEKVIYSFLFKNIEIMLGRKRLPFARK